MLHLADLAHLARPGSGNANLDVFEGECQRLGLAWPRLVVEQFLFDHGDKPEFLEQYGHLDLLHLHWTLRKLPARELLGCSYYDEFGDRVRSVAESARWMLDQYREVYGEVWDGSWRVPPVFIEGALHDPPQDHLHLVEGHTRLGVLIGLANAGEVSPDSTHEAFVASRRGS